MGHLLGKDLYRAVGRKLDGLTMRAPWNDSLRNVLEALYTPAEAGVFVAMPYDFSSAARIARATGRDVAGTRAILEGLADKGLVIDVLFGDAYHYMPSPMVIGVFEFTMMRTGPEVDSARLGRLFHDYLSSGALHAANCQHGERVGLLRAVPHDGTVAEHVEVLDHERALSILEGKRRFAVGICSCRHEKEHVGGRGCDHELGVCTSFDGSADYLVRHGLAREIDRAEMLDLMAASRARGNVLSADNVQRNVTFLCHCCACCCNVLQGISRFGYPNMLVTSSFLAAPDLASCQGCGDCAAACPIDAIAMVPADDAADDAGEVPSVDGEICVGCGVCALACSFDAMRLDERGRRVLHPETTFRRVILQTLERGTLQNQIFADPTSLGQNAMRAVVGAFLGLPPVKRALMSDLLRSRFLAAMEAAVRRSGSTAVLDA